MIVRNLRWGNDFGPAEHPTSESAAEFINKYIGKDISSTAFQVSL